MGKITKIRGLLSEAWDLIVKFLNPTSQDLDFYKYKVSLNQNNNLSTSHPHIIIYDALCKLCNGSVNFIIKRDSKAVFKFQALQNVQDFQVLESHFPKQIPDSIIYIEEGKIFSKSTAALRICKKLDGLWPLFYILIIIPKGIRDYIYDWIARNRYSWFGKHESCLVPDENIIDRFI